MSYADRLRRTTTTLGAIAALTGLIGFYVAREIPFDAGKGVETLFPSYELHGMTFNRLGALVVLALGLVGLVAGLMGKPMVAAVPAFGFLLLAGQVLLQWRDGVENILAATGQNLAFALTMALGFGVVAFLSRVGADLDRA